MKTKEELDAIKEEVKALNKKLHELTEEELIQVAGGVAYNNYMVQAEDTLSGIAQKLGVPQSTLATLNGITNPDAIYVGQVLIYPC